MIAIAQAAKHTKAPMATEITELITMLVRFRTRAIASVTATLATPIASTVEAQVSQLLGGFIEKTLGACFPPADDNR